jgi:hypothetical protein
LAVSAVGPSTSHSLIVPQLLIKTVAMKLAAAVGTLFHKDQDEDFTVIFTSIGPNAAKSPRLLPPELSEAIIEQIEWYKRRSTLLRCALVCKDWLVWTRMFAFRDSTYILSNHRDALLSRESTTAPFISHIEVRLLWEYRKKKRRLSSSMSYIFFRLNESSCKLHHLTLQYMDSKSLNTDVWENLSHLLSSNVRYLRISYCVFDHPAEVVGLISAAQSVIRLELSSCYFRQNALWPTLDNKILPEPPEHMGGHTPGLRALAERYSSLRSRQK